MKFASASHAGDANLLSRSVDPAQFGKGKREAMAALVLRAVQNPNMCTRWQQQQEAPLDEDGGGAGGGGGGGIGGRGGVDGGEDKALHPKFSRGKEVVDTERAVAAVQSSTADATASKLNSMALDSTAVSADVVSDSSGGGSGKSGADGRGRKGGVVRTKQKVQNECAGTALGHHAAGGHALPLINFSATNEATQTNRMFYSFEAPPPPSGEADGAAGSSSSAGDKRKTHDDADEEDDEVYLNCICTIYACTSRYVYLFMHTCHDVYMYALTCMYACRFVYVRVCVHIKSIHTPQTRIHSHPCIQLNHVHVHIGPFKWRVR